MSYYYQSEKQDDAIAIKIVIAGGADIKLTAQEQAFVTASQFRFETGRKILMPNADKAIYYACIHERPSFSDWEKFVDNFPSGTYILENPEILDAPKLHDLILAWGLHYYRYQQFFSDAKPTAILILPSSESAPAPQPAPALQAKRTANSLNWGRDLINHPANYLTPEKLTEEASNLAATFSAKIAITDGEVLEQCYPLIHAVGKAAYDPPRLIELKWESPTPAPATAPAPVPTTISAPAQQKNFNLTLVGKGVTFDSGGLDLKPSKGMLLMKKDMGGAAHVLALARMIMENNLPINLRVLIPAVENAVSNQSFRPMDILTSRFGLSVEVGNTDAEGRLILADALTAACEEQPDMIIDFATLTGAARIATGTELPNIFSNRENLCDKIKAHKFCA